MKRILIAAMFVAAPAFAVQNSDPKAEDAIKAVFAGVDTCVNNNDSKCLSKLFADGATFAGPLAGGKIVKGKAEIIKAFEAMMKEPGTKGVKQKRSVENVRFVGEDRALVDCSVKLTGMKAPEAGAADEPQQTWHSTALMALEGGKWLLEDVRFYTVETGPPPTQAPRPTVPAPPVAPPKT